MYEQPPHRPFYCDHCERPAFLCGTCGNNTCNAGYGEVMGPEQGTTIACPYCPSAYDLDKRTKFTEEEIQKLKDEAC